MSASTHHDSLAFGEPADVTDCTRIFNDVGTAMAEAWTEVTTFRNSDEAWEGETADEVRDGMADLPELLNRFRNANETVAGVLEFFAYRLSIYQDEERRLAEWGERLEDEFNSAHRRRDAAADRVRSDPGSLAGVTFGLVGVDSDPEVSALDHTLDELQRELAQLRLAHNRNDEEFEACVVSAVEAIRDTDSVLYNSDWDQFWNQTLSPILDTIRTVVEILAVIVTIVVMATGVGTLLALALGVMLLALSLADVVGTAAAGRDVTAEQWIGLALDVAAVATLGAARWASGAKLAGNASRAELSRRSSRPRRWRRRSRPSAGCDTSTTASMPP